jgi:plasmid maintenance system antidote protein VapI
MSVAEDLARTHTKAKTGIRVAISPGDKFGWWEVVHEIEPTAAGMRRFLCRCRCGTTRPVNIGALRSSQSQSCGCAKPTTLRARLPENFRFGPLLASLIKSRGIFYSEFARRIGKRPTTITNIIYNISRLLPPTIDQFADALEATDQERVELHLAAARDRGYKV